MERGGFGGDFVLSENANKYYFLYCREREVYVHECCCV